MTIDYGRTFQALLVQNVQAMKSDVLSAWVRVNVWVLYSKIAPYWQMEGEMMKWLPRRRFRLSLWLSSKLFTSLNRQEFWSIVSNSNPWRSSQKETSPEALEICSWTRSRILGYFIPTTQPVSTYCTCTCMCEYMSNTSKGQKGIWKICSAHLFHSNKVWEHPSVSKNPMSFHVYLMLLLGTGWQHTCVNPISEVLYW